MTRLAAIDGGTYYHHRTLYEPPFTRFFDRTVHVREIGPRDLAGVDVLVVPCRLNPCLVTPLGPLLQAFMRGGGTLVAMGETLQDRWLHGIAITPVETNYWWWLEPGADLGLRLPRPDHPLFRRLDRAAVTWHLHGWFHAHPHHRSLVDTAEGCSILFEGVVSFAPGRLVATTLDPCYHHGSHFMPATTRFLEGFLPWLKEPWNGVSMQTARETS